jgi:hypothetical protein
MFLVYVKICVIFSSGAIRSNYKMKSREPDFTCVAIILMADSLNIHCFLPFSLRLQFIVLPMYEKCLNQVG